MNGTLYLVATPIGNLQDITFRAVETLKKVDVIACEDTRRTRKLLTHFGISAKLVSYHEHNEQERAAEFAELLQAGKNIAVVSDAGTPGICDPSFRLVQKAVEIGARIEPVPGAAAFVNALIASGLPTDSLFFGGFLPAKKNERRARLAEVKEIPATLVFYETPHRLRQSLADCLEVLGNRNACVARELTKLHEEFLRGNLAELREIFTVKEPKGEFVIVIDKAGNEKREAKIESRQSFHERVSELEDEGIDRRTALKQAAKEFGLKRDEAYRILMTEK